jgi:Zn-dependent peptidase ImmA (M78 family)
LNNKESREYIVLNSSEHIKGLTRAFRLEDMENLIPIVDSLINKSKELGYRVNYAGHRDNEIIFNHKIIFINQLWSINTLYSLVHEMGHAIDHNKGNFNSEKYKSNKKYKVWKEFVAWWYGFCLCVQFRVPIKGFFKQFTKSWFTYIKA